MMSSSTIPPVKGTVSIMLQTHCSHSSGAIYHTVQDSPWASMTMVLLVFLPLSFLKIYFVFLSEKLRP